MECNICLQYPDVLWHITDSRCKTAAQKSEDAYSLQQNEQILLCLTISVRCYHPHPSYTHPTEFRTSDTGRSIYILENTDFIGLTALTFNKLPLSVLLVVCTKVFNQHDDTEGGGTRLSVGSYWKRRNKWNYWHPKFCDITEMFILNSMGFGVGSSDQVGSELKYSRYSGVCFLK